MTKASLNYTGEVVWKPPAIYKSSCKINVEWFPFDEQSCDMKFGSWTYDGYQLDLKHVSQVRGSNVVNIGIDLKEFYLSVEWDILAVPATRNEEYLTSDRGDDEIENLEDEELKEEFRGKLFTGNKRIVVKFKHFSMLYYKNIGLSSNVQQIIFPDITFLMTLRRKTLFYTVNLIIPCVGISFLTVLVFYLPSDSGEKVNIIQPMIPQIQILFHLILILY